MDVGLREKYFAALDKEIRELVDKKTGLLAKKYSRVVSCPVCAAPSARHEKLFVKRGYTFVRCRSCELIFTNPQVKAELLGELYGQSKSNDLWTKVQESAKEKAWKKDYYLEHLKLLKRFMKKREPRLLDVGCSSGYFMELSQKKFPRWQIEGLEVNQTAYRQALAKGLKVKKLFLNELDGAEKYDVFTMFGLWEHLPAPAGILKDIKKHARPGALVLAIVPNVYSLYHMFLQQASRSFDGRNHLIYFSTKTLRYFFERHGFKEMSLDTVLTGWENIMRQIQWYNPYDAEARTMRYVPQKLKKFLTSRLPQRLISKYDLGLRIRILAKWSGR